MACIDDGLYSVSQTDWDSTLNDSNNKPVSVNQVIDLPALRARLASFELVRCGMRHEQIQREPDGLLPLVDASVDHGFVRETYCDSAIRSSRLSCAHTTARYKLAEMLDQIPGSVRNAEQVSQWKEKISKLDMAIIEVDQKKSDAELVHARESDRVCASLEHAAEARQALDQISLKIRQLVSSHNAYSDQLSELLREILACIDAAITDRQ